VKYRAGGAGESKFAVRVRKYIRDHSPWIIAAVLACALLVWTAFNVLGAPGGLSFSALLLLTLLVVFYAAWMETSNQSRSLKSSEDLLSEAIEGLPHGFELYDADDRLVMCNEVAIRLQPHLKGIMKPGMKFETAARLAAESGFVPEAIGRIDEWVEERMALHRAPSDAIERRNADGRWYVISESMTRDGGIVCMRTDITERKQADVALVAAKEQAELASSAKTEFLANMSHDLRTPLNAIIGFADIMKAEMLGPIGVSKYSEYAAAISDSGSHLLHIINDILDLSKFESVSVNLNDEEFDVETVINDVLTLLTLKAESSAVDLVKVISAELPRLNADKVRVKQMLGNLLSNAVKFTPRGGTVKSSRSATTGAASRSPSSTPGSAYPMRTSPWFSNPSARLLPA
jgi:nitrogen-specific signal transduction histidine kinase